MNFSSIADLYYAVSLFLGLGLVIFLWWLAASYRGARRFWGLLALGWTVNTLASLAWGLSDLLQVEPSWLETLIAGMYISRYLFVGLALWLHPKSMPIRRVWEILGVTLLAAGILWVGFVVPLQAQSSIQIELILARTIFPLLDTAILYMAWTRYRSASGSLLEGMMGWVVFSAMAYGVANWANFWARTLNPDADTLLALAGWLLTDVFILAAGMVFLREARRNVRG